MDLSTMGYFHSLFPRVRIRPPQASSNTGTSFVERGDEIVKAYPLFFFFKKKKKKKKKIQIRLHQHRKHVVRLDSDTGDL